MLNHPSYLTPGHLPRVHIWTANVVQHILNLIVTLRCMLNTYCMLNCIAWILAIWVMRIFSRGGLDRKTFWDQVPPPLQLGLSNSSQTCWISPFSNHWHTISAAWRGTFESRKFLLIPTVQFEQEVANFLPALPFLLSFSAWSVLTANIFLRRLTFEISDLHPIKEPPQFQLF